MWGEGWILVLHFFGRCQTRTMIKTYWHLQQHQSCVECRHHSWHFGVMRRLIGDDGVPFWTADTSLADTRTREKDTKNHQDSRVQAARDANASVHILLTRTGTFLALPKEHKAACRWRLLRTVNRWFLPASMWKFGGWATTRRWRQQDITTNCWCHCWQRKQGSHRSIYPGVSHPYSFIALKYSHLDICKGEFLTKYRLDRGSIRNIIFAE